MSNFKIVIRLDKDFFDIKQEKELEYYSRQNISYKDQVQFSNNEIIISGTRSKKISSNAFETLNSTYYLEIIKCLLYTYFRKGNYIIKEIIMNQNEDLLCHYYEHQLEQNFTEKLDEGLFIDLSLIYKMSKERSDKLANSLMNIVMGIKSDTLKFDYIWRGFNTLLKYIYNDTDFEMLIKLRNDLEDNPNDYRRIIDFAQNIDFEYLDQCFLRQMILNNIKKGENREAIRVEEFFVDFVDHRVCRVLKKCIDCKRDILISSHKWDNVLMYLDSNIDNCIVKDTDVIRLLINKYCYYLRCKYFHGEKMPVNFVIQNENYFELNRISKPLIKICFDLIEINFLT